MGPACLSLLRKAPRDRAGAEQEPPRMDSLSNSGKKIKLPNLFSLVQGFCGELEAFNCASCEESAGLFFETTTTTAKTRRFLLPQVLFKDQGSAVVQRHAVRFLK